MPISVRGYFDCFITILAKVDTEINIFIYVLLFIEHRLANLNITFDTISE